MDETGVFTDPAEPGALGNVPLQDGTGVRIPAILHGSSNLFLNEFDELFHAGGENIVIVFPSGIGGDLTPPPRPLSPGKRRIVWRG
jgi:hypothetical protein